MKFAGSFVAVSGAGNAEPEIPKVAGETVGSVRVNSVGTILQPPPKPVKEETETPIATTDDTARKEVESKEKSKTETETEAKERSH